MMHFSHWKKINVNLDNYVQTNFWSKLKNKPKTSMKKKNWSKSWPLNQDCRGILHSEEEDKGNYKNKGKYKSHYLSSAVRDN
jgi:hypothetical protein